MIRKMIAIEDAHTKCPYCGIIYPLVPPPGERRHDDTTDPRWGCNTPLTNPRSRKDGQLYTCFSCNITEGYGTTGKKIKSRFTSNQRSMGGMARCKSCVGAHRTRQFPAYEKECRDTSLGAALHDAVQRLDTEAVSHLLFEANADPNYAQQACIQDTYGMQHSIPGKYYKRLWNPLDGSIVQDTDNYGEQLQSVVFMLSDVFHGGLSYGEYQSRLNTIATMLIDAGATGVSLSAAAELMKKRYGYQYDENFNESDSTRYPATITIWKAQRSIQQLLRQCKEQAGKGGNFDFGEYFKKKKSSTSASGGGMENNDTTSKTIALTEKAVQNSSDYLLPYYLKYAFQRAKARFESHHSQLFGRKRRQHRHDGTNILLPALPKEIEANIRALALVSSSSTDNKEGGNYHPIITATNIPDPISWHKTTSTK